MPNIDFFQFFRYTLGTIATVYATVVTLQGLWQWYVLLAANDKYIGMIRRYIIVHGLRLRFTAFWGDVLICLLLCVVFVLIWRAHSEIFKLGAAYRAIQHLEPAVKPMK
jgi:hypothetical protein